MAPYRVLVVDDSAFMRKIISDLIIQDSAFTIVATASNGLEAIEAVAKWNPDAVTIDLEMPVMNGLEALQIIMKNNPVPVIMLSGISEDNTRETIKALQFGAFDFIRKPSSAVSNDIHQVGENLLEKLRIAVLTKRHQPMITITESIKTSTELPHGKKKVIDPVRNIQPRKQEDLPSGLDTEQTKAVKQPLHASKEVKPPKQSMVPPLHTKPTGTVNEQKLLNKQVEPSEARKPSLHEKPSIKNTLIAKPSLANKQKVSEALSDTFKHIVAIGTSTGGPRALHEVITSLPNDFPAPVLVVQHMPPKFTKSLAQRLDSFSALHVVEAEHGEHISAGKVYIAPGGYHMKMVKDARGYSIQLTAEPQRNGHRPSVDVLFESLTEYRELNRHVVLMTGMGSDGAKGMKLLVESGVQSTIAEAEETCVVYGMPRSAIEEGSVKTILPLQHIASQLVQAVSN